MEPNMFDNVRFEKENAIARFNHLRRIAKLWRVFEFLLVLGLISWSSTRVPTILRIISSYFVEFTNCLYNHHVVFLIGNSIIVLLFMLCRQNDAVYRQNGDDLYDDYVKHSEAAAVNRIEPSTLPPVGTEEKSNEEKQIMVVKEEAKSKSMSQCDDVAAAIEQARKQIKKFERTQSEKLKREISVRPRSELRRSQTENCRKIVSCGASEIETLSNEEFRRTVDDFIDKHWSKTKKIMSC